MKKMTAEDIKRIELKAEIEYWKQHLANTWREIFTIEEQMKKEDRDETTTTRH